MHRIRQICLYRLGLVLLLNLLMGSALQASEQLPVASFKFERSSYEENEPIEVIDTSLSPSGSKLVKREWKAKVNGKWKIQSTVKSLLADVKAGDIEIYLRVKDAEGLWSHWTSQKIKITEAKGVQIVSFKSEKTVYEIGEKLQIDIIYDNPKELNITSQRWRYRNVSTNGATISGKPKYFKNAGTYEISLEVQDEWGNWSDKVSCQVHVSNEAIERDGYYLFEKGKQGDLIDGYIDKDYNSFMEANTIEVKDVPGTLILSNSPESIPSSGILYQDTVSGEGRILVHHLNATEYSKKLMILVSVADNQEATLKVTQTAIEGPAKNILVTGQKAVMNYLKGSGTQTYTIKPGQTLCIYDSSKIRSWQSDEVISGTLDFITTGKVTFKVVAMDEKSGIENLNQLNVLPKSIHKRGTFSVIQREYLLDLQNMTAPVKLVLGREQEEWLYGVDALTGEAVWNQGNYGLPIKITIKNNEDVGVVLNARGGGYLGAVKWQRRTVFAVPNETVLTSQKVAVLVGTIKAGTSNEILYMLPNGSSAPVLFGFIPKSVWK